VRVPRPARSAQWTTYALTTSEIATMPMTLLYAGLLCSPWNPPGNKPAVRIVGMNELGRTPSLQVGFPIAHAWNAAWTIAGLRAPSWRTFTWDWTGLARPDYRWAPYGA